VPRAASDPAWAPLKNDIVFDVALPSLSKVKAVSPDWEKEPGKVKVFPNGKGRYRITLPKESLKCYTILFLQE
jgi:hypothetical protein